MAELKPLDDRVLIEPLGEQEKTDSGIYLPDTAKEEPQRGRIAAVGPGRLEDGKRVPLDLAVGDIVIFKEYSPDKIKLNGKEHYFLKADDILAKEA